jgi:NADH-quinone oxidoreductase subunit A
MGQYLPVLTMLVLAVLFGALSRVVSSLLAPRRSNPAKSSPYESGIVPTREPPDRFPVRFYLVAMSFIVFDIEIIFLFPWAVIYRDLGVAGLVAVTMFAVPVILSLVYEIANGAFDWGPAKRLRRGESTDVGMVSAERTTATTVRRVGTEGREVRQVDPDDPAGGGPDLVEVPS